MHGGELLVRRRLEALAEFAQRARLVRNQLEPEGGGIHQHVRHATISDIDHEAPKPWHVDWRLEVMYEGRLIGESHRAHLAAAAFASQVN